MAARGSMFTQDEIDDCLTALIAYAGNVSAAIRYLDAEGMNHPCHATLTAWSRTTHWERYEELREKLSGSREEVLANHFLDAMHRSTEGALLAVEKAIERLEDGKDEDPGRTAANLARTNQSFTDKRMSLQGRPTSIGAAPDLNGALRILAAMGVIQIPSQPEQAQIEGTSSDVDER